MTSAVGNYILGLILLKNAKLVSNLEFHYNILTLLTFIDSQQVAPPLMTLAEVCTQMNAVILSMFTSEFQTDIISPSHMGYAHTITGLHIHFSSAG